MSQMEPRDVLEWADSYTGPPFHALLCDPPYHLTSQRVYSTRKNLDEIQGEGVLRGNIEKNTAYGSLARGFMGQKWDGGDLVFRSQTWAALTRHLHPGAFVMAFASSRGWHRQAVAMEDAGLTIHPTLFGWAFGSGFPKATRIDTAVDREAGVKQEPERTHASMAYHGGGGVITAPATPLARAWAGHRYGLQALKPALEPIIVAQKPYAGKPVESITRTGAGALNIEAGRIPIGDEKVPRLNLPYIRKGDNNFGGGKDRRQGTMIGNESASGRWPSNLYLADPGAAARLAEQSGVGSPGHFSGKAQGGGVLNLGLKETEDRGYTEKGTAARFFFNVSGAICEADPVLYTPKAGRWERDAGLEKMPVGTPQVALRNQVCKNCGGSLLCGTRVGPCCDNPDYKAGQVREVRNAHPTVKPLDLTRYLSRLLLPPADYSPRRLLVPFAGVGSEMIGGLLAGWEEITGIEQDPDYCKMAEARLAFWREAGNKVLDDAVAAERHEEIREMKANGQKELLEWAK